MRTTSQRRLVTMLVTVSLALAGCGNQGADSGGDGGSNGGPAADGRSGEEHRATFDVTRLCSLLERTEIEAVFGKHGKVTEGELNAELRSCNWQMGRQIMQLRAPTPVANPRERLDTERDRLAQDKEYEIVNIDGLGDYAYAILWNGTTQLVFLTKGVVLYLYTILSATDELVTLAGHAVQRV